jgi:signal transduction histidine kinase
VGGPEGQQREVELLRLDDPRLPGGDPSASEPRPPAGESSRLFRGVDTADLAEQMALVVHELRSPLAAIAQVVDLLERTADQPPDPSLLNVARRQAEAGLRRVQQLLVLLRADAGRDTMVPVPQDLRSLVLELTEQQRMTDTHDLILEIDPHLRVEVDREAFAHVLENLLANASRHAPPGSAIVVAAQPRGDEVLVRVVDQGPGIDEDLHEEVFEPFTRGAEGGAGLGLTIVRHMVEAHGGRVWVGLDPELTGTSLVVALPRADR